MDDLMVKWLQLLHEPGDVVEIRSIDPKPVISGYFKVGSPAIQSELAKYPNRTFYQTLNPVKSACYARAQHERLIERPQETTSDNDIAGYSWILIDADPVRPSGVSASKPEKEAARKVAATAMKKLMALGFSEPVVGDSGNGYHLLFRVHACKEEKQTLSDFLNVLDQWFSTDMVKIDTAVFNPARITKLYGTMTHKGANTSERPHRKSAILRFPSQIQLTSMDLVRNIASACHKAVQVDSIPTACGNSSFNLERFLSDHAVQVAKKVAISNGIKYQLVHCPFDTSHVNGDAAVFAYSNGRFGFHCFHNSCSGYHWHEFREKIDPMAYANTPFTLRHNLMALDFPIATAADKYDMQSRTVKLFSAMAKELNVHIHFICHPRKTESFLRKGDISGTADITNIADNVFMVHRVNVDFMGRYKTVYPQLEIPRNVSTVVEVMKNRDLR